MENAYTNADFLIILLNLMQTWKVKKKAQTKKQHKPWGVRILAVFFLVATVLTYGYDFPKFWNQTIDQVHLPSQLKMSEQAFRLGLDLQGGTHLIYETDMRQIPEAQKDEALEGVRDVIERRVNAFGVSEPVVQTTSTNGAYRVIVELAGVLDVSEAISQIGETPVLEFKEAGQKLDRALTDEEKKQLAETNIAEKKSADVVLARALKGEDFTALIKENSIEQAGDQQGILKGISSTAGGIEFIDAIKASGLKTGQINRKVIETSQGLNIFRLDDQRTAKEMNISHILVCFAGKTGCQNERNEMDASIKIQDLLAKATPDNFAQLAKENSDDPSVATNGGVLGWSTGDNFVEAFKLGAGALQKGGISKVAIETEYGYHIVYKSDEREAPVYDVSRILMPFSNEFDIVPPSSPWVNTELSGKHLEQASVQFDPNTQAPHVALKFNAEGGDLFGKLTASHIGQPIAIFLDGEAISTPTVQNAIYGGQAVITGDFSIDEAKLLAQRLNAGALPVPVELLSQQRIGPTLGAVSLEQSVTAALYGFLFIAIFMIAMYRFPGFVAVVALFFFAAINLALSRIFGVTITLAGIAGFVLSLGIAVDANVLIIERLKEEINAGRGYVSALEEAFKRAWGAIRDGNTTTLIAAAVLYWFSSSFIRGFALTLSIGVLLSMFTAATVARVYMMALLQWKWLHKPVLFNVKK